MLRLQKNKIELTQKIKQTAILIYCDEKTLFGLRKQKNVFLKTDKNSYMLLHLA